MNLTMSITMNNDDDLTTQISFRYGLKADISPLDIWRYLNHLSCVAGRELWDTLQNDIQIMSDHIEVVEYEDACERSMYSPEEYAERKWFNENYHLWQGPQGDIPF